MCNFFKLVTAETASIIFGGFDGNVGTLGGEFSITYDGEDIQGELQDEVLAKVEASGLFVK